MTPRVFRLAAVSNFDGGDLFRPSRVTTHRRTLISADRPLLRLTVSNMSDLRPHQGSVTAATGKIRTGVSRVFARAFAEMKLRYPRPGTGDALKHQLLRLTQGGAALSIRQQAQSSVARHWEELIIGVVRPVNVGGPLVSLENDGIRNHSLAFTTQISSARCWWRCDM